MSKKFWITDSRFKIIIIILIILWVGMMILFYLKADEVTKHPCSICAKQIGGEVVCTLMDGTGRIRVFDSNFIIEDKLLGES